MAMFDKIHAVALGKIVAADPNFCVNTVNIFLRAAAGNMGFLSEHDYFQLKAYSSLRAVASRFFHDVFGLSYQDSARMLTRKGEKKRDHTTVRTACLGLEDDMENCSARADEMIPSIEGDVRRKLDSLGDRLVCTKGRLVDSHFVRMDPDGWRTENYRLPYILRSLIMRRLLLDEGKLNRDNLVTKICDLSGLDIQPRDITHPISSRKEESVLFYLRPLAILLAEDLGWGREDRDLLGELVYHQSSKSNSTIIRKSIDDHALLLEQAFGGTSISRIPYLFSGGGGASSGGDDRGVAVRPIERDVGYPILVAYYETLFTPGIDRSNALDVYSSNVNVSVAELRFGEDTYEMEAHRAFASHLLRHLGEEGVDIVNAFVRESVDEVQDSCERAAKSIEEYGSEARLEATGGI